jgi:hypothetical protein
MADYGCMIAWDRVAIGRERKAMELWADALDFYEKARANGQIEGYEALGFESNAAHLLGCILIRGTRDQIQTFTDTTEFQALQQRASMVVNTLTVTRFQGGEAMAANVASYMGAIDTLGV